MKKLLLTLLLCFYANLAHSTTINGTHFLDDGRQVDLQGLEWSTLSETAGIPRITPNLLEHFPGWRYAASWEVEKLFASLSGGATARTDQKWLTGATWFSQTFGINDYSASATCSAFFYGTDEEIAESLGGRNPSYHGDAFLFHLHINHEYYFPYQTTSASLFLTSSGITEALMPLTSHMLVRGPLTSPVPEPTTTILIGVGLIFYTGTRRKLSKIILNHATHLGLL